MARGRKIAAVVTSEARLIDAPSSMAILHADSPLRRRPRAPSRLRSPEWLERFESRVLFYDAFWHVDGQRILLVGPPPLNLGWEYQTAKFTAMPLDFWLGVEHWESPSLMLTQLEDVPRGTREIVVRIGGRRHVLPIRQNFAGDFAGRNVLVAMSRDAELDWIVEWARYHTERQGVDGLVLFDNGSTRYGVEEIEERLLAIPSLAKIAVLSWPGLYGEPDPAVVTNRTYPHFINAAALSVALRRFAPLARGLLSCAVDELVETPAGTTIFDMLPRTSQGLIAMRGRYMEAVPTQAKTDAPTQRDYPFVLKDTKLRQSRQKIWALEPTRPWVASLGVHPYRHSIAGRPPFSKAWPDGTFYRKFRALDPATPEGAPAPAMADLHRDPGFDALFAGD